MQVYGGANVHNDTYQFLAEFGSVGFGLILATVLCFIIGAIWKVSRFSKLAATFPIAISPKWIYRLPPEALAIFVASVATIVHSLGDLPFRTPAVLLMWVCAWVCMDGYIPTINRK